MVIGIDFRMGGSKNAGIGRYIFELLKALLSLDEKNSYVIFFNPASSAMEDIKILSAFANVKLVTAPFRHYSVSEQVWFYRLISSYELDLMHFPNFNVPILYKKPFVVTIHDMVHHKISGHKKSRLLYFEAYKYIIKKAAQKARRILTVSHQAKKDIIQILNTPEQKITVTYEGSSLKPQRDSAVIEVKKGFLLDKPYFLFVGTLERKKNVVNLVKAFNLFLEKYKLDIALVIAGKVDTHYPEIKQEALKIKHRAEVVFTGYVSDLDLACLYQGAYAFVSASLHEGFGLPGVEAMTFGLPLVISNLPVFNEVYDNAGIYFDPLNIEDIAEKMHLIASDSGFYKQMQTKSLSRGLLFDWSKTAHDTLAVYYEASPQTYAN